MRILLPLLVFAFLRTALFAQDLRVLWGEQGIQLGGQVCFTLISKELVSADSLEIELSRTNEDWEYIRSEVLEDRVLVWAQCFALEASLFPGLSIRYQKATASTSLVTGPQYFYVASPEIDPDADPPIRGIRALEEDEPIWQYVLIILLVLLLGIALGLWLRKRKKKGYSLPGTQEITDPWKLARERIDMLRQHIPRDEAGIKEHVFLLHETVKQYLGGRVGYSFLEMTSAEVADAYARFVWTSAERAQRLRVWLQRGDMAKFARELPDTKELARYIDTCESWLADVECDWQSYQQSLQRIQSLQSLQSPGRDGGGDA